MGDNGYIGVFDSGVGGLSVWREIVRQLPHRRTIYLADQAHVPYGCRSLDEVRRFAEEITRFLLAQRCRIIVIASNTTSAAALYHLRKVFPGVPFVGMEPALKPAIERTRTGAVGVIATPATFQGELFANLVKRYTERLEPQPNGDCGRRRHVRLWASQVPSYYAGRPDVAPDFRAQGANNPKFRSSFPKKPSLYDKKMTIGSTDEVWLHSQACPGLVEAVEAGALDCEETEALLEKYISPMIEADVDQLVLGCTHYPFLRPVIERLLGPGTAVIDPAPSVARQVANVLTQQENGTHSSADAKDCGSHTGRHVFYTSSDVFTFSQMIEQLLSSSLADRPDVRPVAWQDRQLEIPAGE